MVPSSCWRRRASPCTENASRSGTPTADCASSLRRRLKLEAQSAVGVPDLEAFSVHGLARRRQQLEGTIFGLRQAKNCNRALRLGLENEKPMTDGASEAAKPDNKETL